MTVGRLAGQNEGLSFLTEIPLGRLTSYAKPRQYPAGSRISEGSELSEAAWFIFSGSCELRRTLQDGSQEAVTTFMPGEAFGIGSKLKSLKSQGKDGGVDSDEEQVFAVATSDSVLLCFDRATLQLLRLENERSAGNGNGNGNGHHGNGKNGSDGYRSITQGLLPGRAHEHGSASRLITLAFVSNGLPASLISRQFARSLHAETDAQVVLIRCNYTVGVRRNGDTEFGTRSTPEQIEDGIYELEMSLSAADSLDRLLSLVQLKHFPYILVQAGVAEQGAPWMRDLLVRSDLAYLFLRSGGENVYLLEQIVREVRARGRNQAAQVKPIACLTDGEAVDGFDLLAQNVGTPVHLYIRSCPADEYATASGLPPRFAADVRRLAREAGGCLIGLALSSGAAKGFAHIGVIQVLEENGIEVDIVAGASMGAYVGSIWAYGHDGTEMERLAREVEGRWKLWSLVDPIFPPRQGFLRGFAIKRRLERSLGSARFADLVRPMRVVATNLITLERKVFSAGQVSTAVHASVAVPGICVPVTIDGETYIDGGIMDPLPVEVLREMGVAKVIAVDAIPTPDTMRTTAEAESAKEKRARNIFRKAISIDKQLNYFARGNLFEILMRSVHGAQIRAAEASCRQADVVLRPDILDDRWLDFRHPGKFIALGREVAFRHLDELQSLTQSKNENHEPVARPMAAFA
jgi:NTE family protein